MKYFLKYMFLIHGSIAEILYQKIVSFNALIKLVSWLTSTLRIDDFYRAILISEIKCLQSP